MPFKRPSLADLVDQVETDIDSRLPDAGARARRSVLGVLARAVGGVGHLLFGYLSWLSRQVFVHSAEAEALESHGRVWGISRKAAATAGGDVIISGAAGTMVPAGTDLLAVDGRRYTVTTDTLVEPAGAAVPVTASVSGLAGNAAAGLALTLQTPVPGVESRATVAAGGLSGGADGEADEAYRSRILTRIQQPPAGGAPHDYVAWALAVPGVGRAWCSPREMGAGTVTVRLLDSDGGIPDATLLAGVTAHIEAARPIGADVYVLAPVAVPMAVEIAGLDPATPEVKAAVEAELADLLRREAAPGGTILISHIREAISLATGEHDHRLIAPAGDVAHATGEIAVLGPITWS